MSDIRKIADFDTLTAECLACERCGLCKTRHNVVVGVGNKQAEVLFVGEGPGENEDLQGEPFVGRGGKLLDLALEAVGLSNTKPVYGKNGDVDMDASRRVTFRFEIKESSISDKGVKQ